MLVGGATMMLISFLFIPNVLCSLWVAFSIVSIELGVVGYMALWNVNLDTISMVNLIMCIGFSVDFTAHICYAYMSSAASRPEERVRESLYALGLPIVQGAVSTVLGVSALVLAGSYIFMVFFKMIFLVIVFGALHGLLLLPVLLSLFGPGACGGGASSEPKQQRHRRTARADHRSLPRPYCIPHPSLLHPGAITTTGSSAPQSDCPGKPGCCRPDKDLGLGTSAEESSESCSSSLHRKRMMLRRREAEEDEIQRRRYMDGWRKGVATVGRPAQQQQQNHRGYQQHSGDEDRKRGYSSTENGGGYVWSRPAMVRPADYHHRGGDGPRYVH